MDIELTKRIVSRFNKAAFISFINQFFGWSSGEKEIKELEQDIYYQPLLDSYGGSIHSIFLTHFLPLELLNGTQASLDEHFLKEKLAIISENYKGRVGYWGMMAPVLRPGRVINELSVLTNFSGLDEEYYHEYFFPVLSKTWEQIHGKSKTPLFIGSYDSFLDYNAKNVLTTLKQFMSTYNDGITISVTPQNISVQEFYSERNLMKGALRGIPYEPVYAFRRINKVLTEFESLLNNDHSEKQLEEFLREYYQLFFGSKYDRIETQLWLGFPDVDINNKNRRVDLFLRNSITSDWEIIELKKAIHLINSEADIPIFKNEVYRAIEQAKNYRSILQQDAVKRHFESKGLKYCEPTVSIIIGRKPNIDVRQWRRLQANNSHDVKILTYDELLSEAQSRIKDLDQL